MRTKQDFEEVKQQVSIEVVANLLLQKQGRMTYIPVKKLEALSYTQKAKVSMTSADAWAVIVFGCGRMSGGVIHGRH